jgi:hypothetical protein
MRSTRLFPLFLVAIAASAQQDTGFRPANPVVQEYKWDEPVTGPEDQAASFAIVLKDGSKRYAVMAWVQDGQLHYIDSEGHQQTLAANVIDRDTTHRLNRQKSLNLRLPPG